MLVGIPQVGPGTQVSMGFHQVAAQVQDLVPRYPGFADRAPDPVLVSNLVDLPFQDALIFQDEHPARRRRGTGISSSQGPPAECAEDHRPEEDLAFGSHGGRDYRNTLPGGQEAFSAGSLTVMGIVDTMLLRRKAHLRIGIAFRGPWKSAVSCKLAFRRLKRAFDYTRRSTRDRQ